MRHLKPLCRHCRIELFDWEEKGLVCDWCRERMFRIYAMKAMFPNTLLVVKAK